MVNVEHDPYPIRKVLFPVDFSDCSRRVLPYARQIAERHEAELYMLYVARDLGYFAGLHVSGDAISGFVKEVENAGKKMIEQLCNEELPGYPKLVPKVVVGEPGAEIVKMIEEEGIDLVVMGTHGRKGLDRALVGSVAEHVIKFSTAPVMTINPFRVKQG